jgi:hypothetical protein
VGFCKTGWIALLVLAPACDEPQAVEDGPTWPLGTAVAVDDIPISIDEVDQASVWVERIEPRSSGPQLRRLALTNVSLPRAVAQAMAPREHARARSEAGEALAALRAGTWSGPAGEVVEGNFQALSIEVWGRALDMPLGEWSDPIDDIGRFLLVKLLEREDLPHTAALRVKIEVHAFPYLPEDADVEAAKERHRLTIVDPAWREIVPELDQYRMGARTP